MTLQPQSAWKEKRVQNWSEQDVHDWICSLGKSLKPLQHKLVGIDGSQLLAISLDSIIYNNMQRKIFMKKLNQIKQANEGNDIHNKPSSRLTLMGLSNQGNTCYLNSSIQALLQTPQLTHYFRKMNTYHMGYNGSMLRAWVNICQYAVKHPHSAYKPSNIYQLVVQSHNSYHFGTQDDAFFALTSIISQLDDDINDNKNGPSRYIMSISSSSSPEVTKPQIIKEFELKHNPMQSNIVRRLLDGIKATKRTCLECGKYSNTLYETQRSVPLPLVYNQTVLKIVLLCGEKQAIFQTKNVMQYSSINVLKYHIQQYVLNNLNHTNIKPQNINIAQIVTPKYELSTEKFIHFMSANDLCSQLNSTAFAICKLNKNKQNSRDILVLSMRYDFDTDNIVDNHLDFFFETLSVSNAMTVTGELILQKMQEIPLKGNKERSLHNVCFYGNQIVQKHSFYTLKSSLNVFIRVMFRMCKDAKQQIIENEFITQMTSNIISNGLYCKLVGLNTPIIDADGAKINLKDKDVEVLYFEAHKNRWKCNLFNEPRITKYLGVKEENLRSIKNVKISFDTIRSLLSKYIQCARNISNKDILFRDIDACINAIHKTEIHDNSSCSLKCEFCNKYSTLIKQEIDIIKAPHILIFNFERAIRENNKRRGYFKKTHLVTFDVNNFKYGESEYDLYAVCNHHGSCTKYGHYTAYVKSIDNRRWFIADDSRTTFVSEDSVMTSSALVLMYKKK